MAAREMVPDSDVEMLADATLTVLEDVGVLCQNEEMLRAMGAAGAVVDLPAQRATFPREVIRRFVDDLRGAGPRHISLSLYGDAPGGTGPQAASTGAHARPLVAFDVAAVGTQVAQFLYDHDTGETRSANQQDFITLIKLGDALHGSDGVGHALSLTDVPPLLEPLQSALLLAEYAHVPGPAFAWSARQVDYLLEMGEVLGLKDWFTWGAVCFAHPLRFDKEVADKFVRQVRSGAPTGLTGMPIAGFTTPITLGGFIAVSSAEHVATWFAARAIHPEVPLYGSMWPGMLNMRTGHVSYCSFEGMFYGFAAVEFLRKWSGISLPVGGGEYCDARAPGMYAALEKAYKAMTIAAFTGEHPDVGTGMLDEGKVLAPVQLLLERELGLGVQHYAAEPVFDAADIAMDDIRHVGFGLTTNHLSTDHTLANFRRCMWLPELLDRAGYDGAVSDARALDRAQGRVRDLLAAYRKPEGREDQLAAMRVVFDRARRELLD